MSDLLQIPHHGGRLHQLKDGSWKSTWDHPELKPQDVATFVTQSMGAGWLSAKPNQLTEADIPVVEAPVEPGLKSASQRLYGVLFRVHEAQGGKKEDFEPWRQRWMNRQCDILIDKYLN